jgi:hypothetical protein
MAEGALADWVMAEVRVPGDALTPRLHGTGRRDLSSVERRYETR